MPSEWNRSEIRRTGNRHSVIDALYFAAKGNHKRQRRMTAWGGRADKPQAHPVSAECRPVMLNIFPFFGDASRRPGSIRTAWSRRQSEVAELEFGRNEGKYLRHFKGPFLFENVRVRILRGQPSSPTVRRLASTNSRKARHWRALAIRECVSRLPI